MHPIVVVSSLLVTVGVAVVTMMNKKSVEKTNKKTREEHNEVTQEYINSVEERMEVYTTANKERLLDTRIPVSVITKHKDASVNTNVAERLLGRRETDALTLDEVLILLGDSIERMDSLCEEAHDSDIRCDNSRKVINSQRRHIEKQDVVIEETLKENKTLKKKIKKLKNKTPKRKSYSGRHLRPRDRDRNREPKRKNEDRRHRHHEEEEIDLWDLDTPITPEIRARLNDSHGEEQGIVVMSGRRNNRNDWYDDLEDDRSRPRRRSRRDDDDEYYDRRPRRRHDDDWDDEDDGVDVWGERDD